MKDKIIIGTRGSQLALWQAEHVKFLLHSHYPNLQVEFKVIKTKGDQILNQSLSKIGGKGLFLKEIEQELMQGNIDCAVHSMKDVPVNMTKSLLIPCILERGDPKDAFVSRNFSSFKDLKEGACIGTSSLRRLIQLQNQNPKLVFKSLRGNVNTRIRKMEEGEFDAIILAAAGLQRINLEKEILETLSIVPAVGQGAIGVQVREESHELIKILKALHHQETASCVDLERYFSLQLEGDCQTPLGAYAYFKSEQSLSMSLFYHDSDKEKSFHDSFVSSQDDVKVRIDQFVRQIKST